MERQGSEFYGLTFALFSGAVLGATAGMLLAPKSGRETRTALKEYATKAEEEVLQKVKNIASAIDACHESCREHMKTCKENRKTEVA
jgi:gas vesicle protein